jgi:thiamine biosynthesis lipoprotein
VLVEVEEQATAVEIAQAVAGCAARIEQKFSRYLHDSVLSRLNADAGAISAVDEETANLLDFASQMNRLSDGLFDITSGVLRRAWTFDRGDRVPSPEEIAALLPLVGWSRVRWERPHLTLQPGMQIDFGGIAKEYAVDQAASECARMSAAPVLVNFGGDIAVTRARHGGQPWRVGIEGIDAQAGTAAGQVELAAGAIATSGDTYRYVKSEGRRLSHILDPRSGRPVEGAPRTITVAAPTCTQAGALTTLAMLKGSGAEAFLRNEGARFWIQRN